MGRSCGGRHELSGALLLVRRRWQTAQVDAASVAGLAREIDVPRPVARALVARGIVDAADAERFLNPRLSNLSDPLRLPGMPQAVERTWEAVCGGQRIVVFGDYDVDGVTGAALLVTVLRRLGASAVPVLPNRVEDGYGLGVDVLCRCLEEHDPQLVITVDCGTGSEDAVRAAAERGVDVIVTDHHEPQAVTTSACAVVNPKLGDDPATADLAGVGVAFKLCHGLVKRGLAEGSPRVAGVDLRDWLDLAALGTVADVVPLVGENRILACHGLRFLETTASPGLCALKEVAGVRGTMDTYHVGFMLGPRLNAAGRLGSAEDALALLLCADAGEAARLARILDEANTERKRIEQTILDEAVAELDRQVAERPRAGLVVARPGWHVGTIGIVASRLVERYYRPSIVIGFDEDGIGRGSGRSVADIDLVGALGECGDLLETFGGHKMAAGLTIGRSQLEGFTTRFNDVCESLIPETGLTPTACFDDWLSPGEADSRLLECTLKLRPFGMGNPTPVWGIGGARVVGVPRVVGKGGEHLKMTIAAGGSEWDAIAFRMGDRDVPDGPLDVLFRLEENTFRGRTTLQLNVQDFRPSDGEQPLQNPA